MPEFSEYAAGTPSWVDLGTADVDASVRFYGDLFGWEATDAGPPEETGGYRMFAKGGRQVAGVGPLMQDGQPPAWTTYVATADADATAGAAREAGGQVLARPFDVLDAGRMAILADPAGAVVGVWQAGRHRGAELANEPGSFCWNELATRDMDAAKRFYGAVFGWEAVTGDYAGAPYTEFKLGGRTVAGGRETSDTPPHWGVAFAVDGCDAAAERARSLGGHLLTEPTTIPAGRFAVLADPQGATFTVLAM